MVFHSGYSYFYRSGAQDRRHARRFFYVKNSGWFVHLRGDQEVFDGIEVNSGLAGPFPTRAEARDYLLRIIDSSRRPFGRAQHSAL